jgi:hypothetical protein
MASTVRWLDHSDTERRRVFEAIDPLEESDGGAPHRSRAGGFRPSAGSLRVESGSMTAKTGTPVIADRRVARRGSLPRAIEAWMATLAVLAAAGCTDPHDGCFAERRAEPCRSLCRSGDSKACDTLLHLDAEAGDLGAQQTLCSRGDMFKCQALVKREPDVEAKRKILEEACAQGDRGAPACADLADFVADPVEKRKLLVRTCATPWGLLACARLADIEPDPALRARRLAAVCVAGLEDRCAQLAELDPSPSSRRALLLAACERMGPDCAIHPINHALAAAKVPLEPADAGGGPR